MTPIEIIREIGSRGAEWAQAPLLKANLAASHWGLFENFPDVPQRIVRLYQDPLTNQEGGLTETRNYSSYARGMNQNHPSQISRYSRRPQGGPHC